MKILKILLIFSLFHMNFSWGLSPLKDYYQYPFDSIDCVFSDSLSIEVSPNFFVHTWHLQPKKDRKNIAIYFLHPGEGNMADYIPRAGAWAQAGYDVIMMDYRGYGHSDAFYIEEDRLYIDEFLDDFIAVAQHFKIKNFKSSGIYGLGIGSIIGQLFLEKHPEQMAFAIYEGFVINPVKYANHLKLIQKKAISLPSSAYSYEKNTKGLKTPTLIFSGTDDHYIKLNDIKNYTSDKKKSRHIVTYPGNHLQGMISLSDEKFGDIYLKHCQEFINKIKQE